jgi:transcriptional regulator with XRE-family HTH domain
VKQPPSPSEEHQADADGIDARARGLYAAPYGSTGRTGGQTLAELLATLRAGRGLTVSRLAERAVVDRRTVQRLERGQLRPRRSTLARIANALDPDRRAEVLGELLAAAGDHVAEDTVGWDEYKTRRVDEAVRAGRWPHPTGWERAIRLSVASEQMFAMMMRIPDLAVAGAGQRVRDLMDLHDALGDEYELLSKEAGSIIHVAPPRRHRGDPVDVSPVAPPLDDLLAVRRWLDEWRVREGRQEPRSARERAIAETGELERRRVRDAPPRRVVRAEGIAVRAD